MRIISFTVKSSLNSLHVHVRRFEAAYSADKNGTGPHRTCYWPQAPSGSPRSSTPISGATSFIKSSTTEPVSARNSALVPSYLLSSSTGNVIVKTAIKFRPHEVDRTSTTLPLSTLSLRVVSLATLTTQDAPRGTRFLSPAPI